MRFNPETLPQEWVALWLADGLDVQLLDQKKAIKLLTENGWTRGVGGKHAVKMTKQGHRPITLPKHSGQTYSKNLSRTIIRAAGLD